MRATYYYWAAGLLLKGIGATWDVSWHFRTLREAISPPHIVNTIGGLLCAYALYREWRERDARRTGPLLVIVAGLSLFLLAMPFDQWWHTTFGIDLTTWSPAHLMLFGGTAVAVFGVLLMFVTDLAGDRPVRDAVRAARTPERLMLAYLVVFFAAAVYFPLTYNEYTTVAAITVIEAPETMDPDLLALARSVEDPVFLNTPRWLYPVYSVAAAAFVGTLARAWLGRGWAFVALAGLAAERALADTLLVQLGWPGAALPFQFLAMALILELAWLPRAWPWSRAVAGAIAASVAGYAYFVYPMSWAPAVPVGATSWPAALVVATGVALLALLLVRRGLRHVTEVPAFELRDVQDWVSAHIARR